MFVKILCVASFATLSIVLPSYSIAQQKILPEKDSIGWLETVLVKSPYQDNAHTVKGRFNTQQRTERLLEEVPGVGLISRGNFAQQPVLHGMYENRVNTLIDGMRIFGACTDNMDPVSSYVEPTNLQQIKIQEGPSFGAGSNIGGAFNFQLNKAQFSDTAAWHAAIGTGYETNAQARQMLGKLSYSSARWALSMDAIYRRAGNYTPGGNKAENIEKYGTWDASKKFTVDSKGRINFSQYEKWNAHADLAYRINAKQTLRLDYVQDDGYHIGYPALTMDVAFAKAKLASLSHRYHVNNRAVSDIETKVYWNYINHAMDDTKRPAEQVSMHMDMPGKSQTWGAYSQGSWTPNAKHLVLVKAEAFRNRWDADMTMYASGGSSVMYMLTIPNAQRFSSGLDVADRYAVSSHLSLEPGVRLQYDNSSIYTALGKQTLTSLTSANPDRQDFVYNAYLKGRLHLVGRWHLEWNVARAMRTPDIKELYSFYLFNRQENYDYVGDPTLHRESAWNTGLSLHYRSEHFSAEWSGFGHFFQNYIAGVVQQGFSQMTEGASGVKQYQNIGNARIVGTSLSLQWTPIEWLQIQSNNTWQMGKDANKNNLPFMPPFHSKTSAMANVQGWNFSLQCVAAATQNKVSSFYGETRTPGFVVFNAGIGKSFEWGKHVLGCSVDGDNLLNRYYYEHLDFVKLPRMGRNVIFHLSYQL